MPSVGSTLRVARLEAGLDLEEIGTRTRISLKNLEAIEHDDLSQITSAFFYKSFVRQICQQLSLPYESVASSVQEAARFYPEPFTEKHLATILQRTLVKPRRRSVDLRIPIATAALLVVLVGCSSLYAVWREQGNFNLNFAPPKLAQLVRSAESLLPSHANADAPSRSQAPHPVTPKAATPESTAGNGFHAEVSAIEPSWLSISADGHETFSGILEPAERKVIEGHETGRVRTGNAGGLKVVFNGKPVGIVGPRGQVRVVVFTRDNYEVIAPNAVHTASTMRTRPAPWQAASLSWNAALMPGLPDSR